MLNKPKAPKHNRIKPSVRKHKKHTDMVKTKNCLICGINGVDPHHLTTGIPEADKGGTGLKTHDKWTVPLCRIHHGQLHSYSKANTGGERAWWELMGINPHEIAKGLWDVSSCAKV